MKKILALLACAMLLASCGKTPLEDYVAQKTPERSNPQQSDNEYYPGKGGGSDNSTLTFRIFDLPGSPLLIRDKKQAILFGSSDEKNADKLVEYLKGEKIEKLEYVFVPSSDFATFTGISKILEKINVGFLGKLMESFEETRVSKLPPSKITLPFTQLAGAKFESNGITFEFLYPMASDFSSGLTKDQTCVILVSKGSFSFLITGDIGESAEKKLIERGKLRKVNGLICTNGAVEGSCSKAFMDIVDPDYVIIGNRGKSPTIGGIQAKGQDAFMQTNWETIQAFELKSR